MKIEQRFWHLQSGWSTTSEGQIQKKAQLVIVFGGLEVLSESDRFNELKAIYPNAHILSCSTAGGIADSGILGDSSIVSTALYFERTSLWGAYSSIKNLSNSYDCGKRLSSELKAKDLRHIFVLADGYLANGSELVKGLSEPLDHHIPITGGLACDGGIFQKTLVGVNEPPSQGKIAVVGFYGNTLKVGHGSKDGWDIFGPERIVTRSEGNVLYEVDNRSVLEMYKSYLGQYASDLPLSARFFPLSLKVSDSEDALVRIVKSVDEEKQGLIFRGDIPEGSRVQLMTANLDRLVEGAISAANICMQSMEPSAPDFAIIISCAGRRSVFGNRTEEEIEEAKRILGNKTIITGFYASGEISPLVTSGKSRLHNQAMTITAYYE
jgi:hypothetical protein